MDVGNVEVALVLTKQEIWDMMLGQIELLRDYSSPKKYDEKQKYITETMENDKKRCEIIKKLYYLYGAENFEKFIRLRLAEYYCWENETS